MNAKGYLVEVGASVARDFANSRSILSYEEYLDLVMERPHQQARGAAQYLRDVFDAFGSEQVPHPTGTIRRFKLFDAPNGSPADRVAGQEEVQNAIYRVLSNFTRSGRVQKLILLHGPNGSAKSSLVRALKQALSAYSERPEGALYRFSWVFPTQELIRGSIGFGERVNQNGELTTFARLEPEALDVQIACELRDPPLFLLPREERLKLLEGALAKAGGAGSFILSDYLRHGEVCQKCRRIANALLASYQGDLLKVLRHVRVERYHLSSRYQVGAVTVEPQLSADASYHQVAADRTQANLPPALQSLVLFEPHGPLVNANHGLIEYADLLKRPMEAFKYLLGFSETGEVPFEHFVLQLDEVLLASTNEKHLMAFKELPDFASFKGRIELVRVPYLRRWRVEQEIYDAQITPEAVGKHVAPHVNEVAARWAVLTRLTRPGMRPDTSSPEVQALLVALTPVEKLELYQDGKVPERLSTSEAAELLRAREALFEETSLQPRYEGRLGASARELKTALLNAAQREDTHCLTVQSLLPELEALCRDSSVYEFLQQEVVDGYHDAAAFVDAVEQGYLDAVDAEVRDSMGLVREGQYLELVERYVQTVIHWVKGEKMHNRVTGESERPDDSLMAGFEAIVMPPSEDPAEFRRGVISRIGAHKVDHPDATMDYAEIFPALFRRLRAHYYEDRRQRLQRHKEQVLDYLSEDRGRLTPSELAQVEITLGTLRSRYGYCDRCARDALGHLMRVRYG